MFAYLNPRNTTKDEKMSVVDSIASATNAKELPKIPDIPLISASSVLPNMEKRDVLIAVCSVLIYNNLF
ncbi:hypothetical protein MASR1M45_07770 [Candidatus Kapaibacterium sp.]